MRRKMGSKFSAIITIDMLTYQDHIAFVGILSSVATSGGVVAAVISAD